MSTEKPLFFVPKCRRCGRAKNQHRAITLDCPIGKRSTTGYLAFSSERFLGDGDLDAAVLHQEAAD